MERLDTNLFDIQKQKFNIIWVGQVFNLF